MSEKLIQGKSLFVTYPIGHALVRAVDGVSLTIDHKESVALVGESGSGKTTLGKIITGLIPHQRGQLFVMGKPAKGVPIPEVQMVFQESTASLNPRLDVGKLVEEGLVIQGLTDRKKRRQHVIEALAAVGLGPEYISRRPYQLSGGQRQRVALARALILRPRLVVLDEPVSALDVTTGAQLLQMISHLQQTYGLAYLMISHNLAVVRQTCSVVMVMYMGKIVEKGPVANVFHDPGHYYTRMLLDAHPAPDPRERNEFTAFGDPNDSLTPPSGCRFHPRCVAAIPRCARIPPGFVERSSGHFAACHLALAQKPPIYR